MTFSSITFLLYFLPTFLIIFHVIPKKFQNTFLLLSSIFFYAWGGPKFIFVILGVTYIDFYLVNKMYAAQSTKTKLQYLIVSLVLNVGLLFYFKYFNFFIDNFNALFTLCGLKPLAITAILLPIGISFYTFESITYVVDVYRGLHKPQSKLLNYQMYILLFPKLIAGPIVRYQDISTQLENRTANDTASIKISGFIIFCIGLAKKTIIANTIGAQADVIFNASITDIDTKMAWIGAVAYTFQIYFDFSGYSDMAIGICKMIGFKIPENFSNPYLSQSITEFWRRWHITLGTWMKHYLYIPLGGNQVNSKYKLYRNLILVFLLSGLWHGASWTFIVWGLFHGLFLVLERLFLNKVYLKMGKLFSNIIVFLIISIGWVYFRSDSLAFANQFIKLMFCYTDLQGKFTLNNDFVFSCSLACIFSFFAFSKFTHRIQIAIYGDAHSLKAQFILTLLGIILFYISLSYISALHFNPFIYFRF